MPGEFTTEQLTEMLAKAKAEAERPAAPVAAPATGEDRYAATVWGQNEYDFTTPSGQTCRMRKLPVEELLRAGILDRVTRLPGIAQEQIDLAEGLPPVDVPEMPDEETVAVVIELVDVLLPLAVIMPKVHSVPKPDESGEVKGREPGRIYTDMIELVDRIAIMERAIGGLKTLDAFRVRSGPAV